MRAALVAITFAIAAAQVPGPRIAFTAATIRPSTPTTNEDGRVAQDVVRFTQGRLSMRNAALNTCLQVAYKMANKQFSTPGDSAGWRYDIDATAPADTTRDQMRLMLQTLLTERLRMKKRMETREVPVDALLVDNKKGHKLHESAEDGEVEFHAGAYQRIPMWEFAWSWSNLLMTPVVDMTGLKGRYDFTLEIKPYLNENTDRAAAFRSAVRDQMGLRVETRKAPVDFLVVEHVEKNPVEE
jgi:uncharacterized protein (TIGR03435 family)